MIPLPPRTGLNLMVGLLFATLFGLNSSYAQDELHPPSMEQAAEIQERTADLRSRLELLVESLTPEQRGLGDVFADVAIYLKAAEWIIRHQEFYEQESAQWTIDALKRGLARVEAASDGNRTWESNAGGVVRGFVSQIDGSVQPYAIYRPEGLDRSRRVRLDVILHGRNTRLNEVRFIRDHDGKSAPEGLADRIILHVYGRGNNAYRWAGETDVFEAIDAVRRTERIDPERIVLRGFSMGGAGAWHLGLHHPSTWAAVEAGAGFSETVNYARLREIPEYQRKTLHLYDAVDYALNAFNVPIVGYGGEEDAQLQASENIVRKLDELGFTTSTEGLETRAEGLDFLRVVGAGMGHRVDDASKVVIDEFLDEHARRGVDYDQPEVRFVTYTTKYNRAAWIQIEEMGEHYRPATVQAKVSPQNREVVEITTENVVVLAVERQVADQVRIDGVTLPLSNGGGNLLPHSYYRKEGDSWIALDYDQSRSIHLNTRTRKHPGLQGPIDDAFTGPFLCVRGTGTAWNPGVQEWANARLDRFASDWDKWMRGELLIKDDTDLTADDLKRSHLILFGDPGSNALIERLMPELPFSWSKQRVGFSKGFDAVTHAPALIVPNPVNLTRYLVINSGHTFGDDAFRGTNALLYPRIGDYALFRISEEGEEVITSGFFDESWKVLGD